MRENDFPSLGVGSDRDCCAEQSLLLLHRGGLLVQKVIVFLQWLAGAESDRIDLNLRTESGPVLWFAGNSDSDIVI